MNVIEKEELMLNKEKYISPVTGIRIRIPSHPPSPMQTQAASGLSCYCLPPWSGECGNWIFAWTLPHGFAYAVRGSRATLDEIEIDGPLAISPQTTIMETLELMSEQNKQSYGVINAQGKLMGMVTKSDLATVGLGDTAVAIQLLQETPPEYIAKTVSGKMIYMDKAYHLTERQASLRLRKQSLTTMNCRTVLSL